MGCYVFFVSGSNLEEYLHGASYVYVWADDLTAAQTIAKSYLGKDTYIRLAQYEEYKFKQVASLY